MKSSLPTVQAQIGTAIESGEMLYSSEMNSQRQLDSLCINVSRWDALNIAILKGVDPEFFFEYKQILPIPQLRGDVRVDRTNIQQSIRERIQCLTSIKERAAVTRQVHSEPSPIRLSLPSWIFGSVLLVFVLGVFIFAPNELPEFKQRLLAFTCALLAGLFGIFLSGDLSLRLKAQQTKTGAILIRATGGSALFVLVLLWWTSTASPVKIPGNRDSNPTKGIQTPSR